VNRVKATGEIDINAVIKKSKEILSSQIDDETVMMDIEKGEYYGINQVGTRIWVLLERPHTIKQLCDTLMEEFEVGEEECFGDVREFVGRLAEKKMVIFE